MSDLLNDKLIYLLQKGIPIVARPFAEIAEELEVPEQRVVAELERLKEQGLVRRFGGVFNSASLGFRTCLCAVDVPEDQIETVDAIVSPSNAVTHCYVRNGTPNFWFTYTAHASVYDAELARLGEQLAPRSLLLMPAVKRYKIRVLFDKTGTEEAAPYSARRGEIVELSESEKRVVRLLQGDISPAVDLFESIAQSVFYSETRLLQLLHRWQEQGALMRVSAIIRHQRFGFNGNAMCVWNVPESRIDDLGAELAQRPEISHCYHREMTDAFPYNLYAMIHSETSAGVEQVFGELAGIRHLENGRMLASTRELKKSSPIYF